MTYEELAIININEKKLPVFLKIEGIILKRLGEIVKPKYDTDLLKDEFQQEMIIKNMIEVIYNGENLEELEINPKSIDFLSNLSKQDIVKSIVLSLYRYSILNEEKYKRFDQKIARMAKEYCYLLNDGLNNNELNGDVLDSMLDVYSVILQKQYTRYPDFIPYENFEMNSNDESFIKNIFYLIDEMNSYGTR